MKILTANQIYQLDKATMKSLGISSNELMEKAAKTCAEWISDQYLEYTGAIHVFCGIGNNGGDGLVISRLLIEKGFTVHTYIVHFSEKKSKDFQINFERLEKMQAGIHPVENKNDLPSISAAGLIIDAVFGIGLSRPVSGFTKQLIQFLNASESTIISIDISSGLFHASPVLDKEAVIKAKHVLTFQQPKIAFLLPENSAYIDSLEILDIGLDQSYMGRLSTNYFYLTIDDIKDIYRKRTVFSHKGTYGHSLLIGGSFGKIGAVILAAKAAMRAGSGLVSTYIPKCGYTAMQASIPEVMVEVDDEKMVQFFNFKTQPTAIGVGPGLGTHMKTKKGFVEFFSNCELPMVIDADALNIISEHKEIQGLIPKNAILTPHPKEFERLVGKWEDDYEKLELLKSFAQKHGCVIVLKGAYTAIAYQENIWFNSSGNPALATAGSGDVLTGIITSLLAQDYTPLEAAKMGVFIHGRTANIALNRNESMESFIASTAISNLGRAFKELE